MLKWSLTGSTKNLHVKTGVLKMSEMTTALQIWANNLFFIDLFQSDTAENESLVFKLLMGKIAKCRYLPIRVAAFDSTGNSDSAD